MGIVAQLPAIESCVSGLNDHLGKVTDVKVPGVRIPRSLKYGVVTEWLKVAVRKTAGVIPRWFESTLRLNKALTFCN